MRTFSLDDPSTGQPGAVPPIDFAAELNAEQHEAVTSPPGPALVLAGAGSGKTRTLTYRVAYLLSQGVRPGEILLLTFTNKAAREMLQRVEELTSVPGRHFWGGTFHHIGNRILRMHAAKVGLKNHFTILDQGDAEGILQEIVKELDPGFLKNKLNPRPRVMSSVWSMCRNTRLSLARTIQVHYPHLEEHYTRLESFFALYQKKKLEMQVTDYDDLLEKVLELLRNHEDIRAHFQERFRYLLVDEYQDTNTLQAEIIDLIGAHHRIMAVGDDAQCIYSWRGANFENIRTFPERHPDTRIFKIETNYRSTPQILNLANNIFQAAPGGNLFQKELRASREGHEKPFVVQTLDTLEQARFVITRVRGLIDEGRSPRDIAILYRAHFQALDLQLELSKKGIPYQITSGVRFFEQAHVRDLIAHLKFIYNPADLTAFQRICALLPKVGVRTAMKLHQLAGQAMVKERRGLVQCLGGETVHKKVPAGAREDWPSFVASLADIEQAMLKGTPQDAVQTALDGWYGDYLKGAYADYTKRFDDLVSFVGFASRYEDIQDMLAQLVLLNGETSDRGADDEEEALRLTTVHQAKGLEYPVVFVIGLAENLFPLRRAIEDGDVEEERRLFYVSVTRAMDELYLSYPLLSRGGQGNSIPLQPSSFLNSLEPELFTTLKIRRTPQW